MTLLNKKQRKQATEGHALCWWSHATPLVDPYKVKPSDVDIKYGLGVQDWNTSIGKLFQSILTNISKTFTDFGVSAEVVLEYAQVLRKNWT